LSELSEVAISVSGLRKSYGTTEAVRGISFDVAVGEVFAFLGANGAGKTTTIEILEGYRERSGGDAEVLGVDPGQPTRGWRERIGLVLQECQLNANMTVRETVGLFANFYPRPRGVEETVELAGLVEQLDTRVGRLSGGQRRRVDVALGIVGDPDLIFLDEPTTGFDPSARRGAWNMIEGLKALGKTIFLTTHYMDEAQHLADRVAILRRGELVALGTMDELGAHIGNQTLIRFRLPPEVDRARVASAIEQAPEVAGDVATVRSANPQRTLYRLTGWAEREGVTLGGLEATRPSLEDIFLEVTDEGNGNGAGPHAADGDGDGGGDG
jgi:ABC-2 type transport system ATP-binding protein